MPISVCPSNTSTTPKPTWAGAIGTRLRSVPPVHRLVDGAVPHRHGSQPGGGAPLAQDRSERTTRMRPDENDSNCAQQGSRFAARALHLPRFPLVGLFLIFLSGTVCGKPNR